MKIFIIISLVAIAAISGMFFRMSWENYKEEEIILNKYWLKNTPVTVLKPLCFGIFLFIMSIFCLAINFV